MRFVLAGMMVALVAWPAAAQPPPPQPTPPAPTPPAPTPPAQAPPTQPPPAQPPPPQVPPAQAAPTQGPTAEPIRSDADRPKPPGFEEEWEVGVPDQLDVGFWLGLNNRLDDPQLFASERDQGIIAGLGFDLFFSRRVAIGLHYEHVELSAEGSGLTRSGTVRIARRLDDLWLGVRMYPLRLEGFGAFIGLGVGLAWQAASLGGSVWAPEDPSNAIQLRCTGHGSANAALRAEVGADADLTDVVRFVGGLGFESYRLSDGLLDDCVPGAGSAVALGLRAGLAFGIGL